MTTKDDMLFNSDVPALATHALAADDLDRAHFAKTAMASLRRVRGSEGLVLSVEGEWGSGKSFVLNMIEALIAQEPEAQRPVVVHFNPWLVGQRDALIRLLLNKLADAVGLADRTQHAKGAAQQLRTYANLFDMVKVVPGAEPWASLLGGLLSSTGKATDAIAKLKEVDLEGSRAQVANALRQVARPVVVLIDDVDRLLPAEIYEVVRLIKSVGSLPQVGYLVAWDDDYVIKGLTSLGIPHAASFLDKIVQIRLPLPALSRIAKGRLLQAAIASIGDEGTRPHFDNEQRRLSLVYQLGLADVLVTPRDIVRVVNTLRALSLSLSGEVCLPDLLGYAALTVKAASVARLLLRHPQYFVGHMKGDASVPDSEEHKERRKRERAAAYAQCERPEAAKSLVQILFPLAAREEAGIVLGEDINAEGHLAAPERLAVVLQGGVGRTEVSLVAVRQFLCTPDRRSQVIDKLTPDNCAEFLHSLHELVAQQHLMAPDVIDACLAVTRLPDLALFAERQQSARDDLGFETIDGWSLRIVTHLAHAERADERERIAAAIAADASSLTVAAELLWSSYQARPDDEDMPSFTCASADRQRLITTYADHVREAARLGELRNKAAPGSILWRLSTLAPSACPAVFEAIRANDPSLDWFARETLRKASLGMGQEVYELTNPKILAAYCSPDELYALAQRRLADHAPYPARAAWMALLDPSMVYSGDPNVAPSARR